VFRVWEEEGIWSLGFVFSGFGRKKKEMAGDVGFGRKKRRKEGWLWVCWTGCRESSFPALRVIKSLKG
jgi:hypothetical protein